MLYVHSDETGCSAVGRATSSSMIMPVRHGNALMTPRSCVAGGAVLSQEHVGLYDLFTARGYARRAA